MQIRITLFLLIGSGTALSQFPPFQFLQKPGPNPVGLKVVNQYDPSRKFPAAPDRLEAPTGQGSRPLQTLIWYPARQSRSKPMTVGDYVVLADREIHFDTPALRCRDGVGETTRRVEVQVLSGNNRSDRNLHKVACTFPCLYRRPLCSWLSILLHFPHTTIGTSSFFNKKALENGPSLDVDTLR